MQAVTRGRAQWLIASSGVVLAFVAAMVFIGVFARGNFWLIALPGYLTGLGTLALALVAYRTMVQEAIDRKALQARTEAAELAERATFERERSRLLAEDRRRQAKDVSVIPADSPRGVNEDFSVQVRVKNLSRSVIKDVTVVAGFVPPEAVDMSRGALPMASTPRILGDDQWIGSINFRVPTGYASGQFDLTFWTVFRDNNNVRWVIDPDHRFAEVDDVWVNELLGASKRGMVEAPSLPGP